MTRALRVVFLGIVALALIAAGALVWIYNDRPDLGGLGLPMAPGADEPPRAGESVSVTWLGVTTLLFDDGETRLLTDGFFSRPGLADVLLDRPVAPDLPGIERALRRAGVTSLAAVMPVHSHFDHAMDAGEVAKRTEARVVGSESTAQVARGAGLPESRIAAVPDGASLSFGRFTVTFVRSRHAPIGLDGGPPFPGTIDAPLVPPAPISAWREGRSYSLVIAHPSGTAVVQGSAGFVAGALADVRADAVFLGVGGLGRLGRAYIERYWGEIVDTTGATRVFPIHYDDFTLPYGEIRAAPNAVSPLREIVAWLRDLATEEAGAVALEMLPFERAVALLPPRRPPQK